MAEVHVLRITTVKHGVFIHVGWTHEDVLSQLRQFVADGWGGMMSEKCGAGITCPHMPENWDLAILEYFDKAGSLIESEEWVIEGFEVQGKQPKKP